jgi:hypothetical protein
MPPVAPEAMKPVPRPIRVPNLRLYFPVLKQKKAQPRPDPTMKRRQ